MEMRTTWRLLTITEGSEMPEPTPIHPGEILREEFLAPLGISQNEAARALDVPTHRVNEIVRGRRRVTTDTALRLAKYLDTSPEFWINLQTRYDLDASAANGETERILRSVRPRTRA